MKDIFNGNAFTTLGERGWFLGHFMKVPELITEAIEAQLTELKAGDIKDAPAFNIKGKTLTLLVDGEFEVIFPEENNKIVKFNKRGDFVYFSNGVVHTWKAIKDSTIFTIRWPSLNNDVVKIK
jgi:hypothetical protein